MKQIDYKVDASCELLKFLESKYPDTSRSKLKELLAHNVYVNGRKISQFNFPLSKGMTVTVGKPSFNERFNTYKLDIEYEDEHLIVVNKHEGLLSYSKNPQDITVISVLNKYLYNTHKRCTAHIVHRLDRDTSGLMIVAKSKNVSRQLEEDWKATVFDRAYVAVVWGNMDSKEGTIKSWLTDGQYCVLSSPVDNGGKLAVTHYTVLRTSRRYSLLELRLETGRRNQIRVHMREEKHPVVHDPMYGYSDDISPIDRLALHAFRLGFIHPVTGKRMQFETPFPKSFMKLMEI